MNSQRIIAFFLCALFLAARVEARDGQLTATNTVSPTPQSQTNSSPSQPKNLPLAATPLTLRAKLQTISVDLKYDALPFDEVLNQLREISKARDPEHRGINFLIDGASAESVKSAKVTINPGLSKLPLRDALDAITHGADQPITYSVFNYAVIFRAGEPSDMRTFRVDPNTFQQGLQGVVGVPFGNVTGNGNGSAGNSGGAQSSGPIVPRADFTRGVSGVTAASPSAPATR